MTTQRLTPNQARALTSYRQSTDYAVAPRDQGQTVVVSYGCSPDFIFERVADRTDRTVCITAYQYPANASDSWDPWNERPDLGRRVGIVYSGPEYDEPTRGENR